MILLIIIKWNTDFTGPNSKNAPSIISYMIGLPLSWGNPGEIKLYESQLETQIILLELCLISVPWMLIPKPLLLWCKHQMKQKKTAHKP